MQNDQPSRSPRMAARISAFVQAGRPYLVWAIPGQQPPAEVLTGPVVVASFLVDAGCAMGALNDPHLTAYMNTRVPVVFACQRKKDRQKLLDRRATFAARGYRLWQEDACAPGAA